LWHLGYPDQALQGVHESLAQASELAQPFSLAYAFVLAGWLHQFRQERDAVQERAEAAIALATDQGFPEQLAWGMIQRGWTLATQGQAEGVAQIRQGLDIVRNIGSQTMLPYLLALLAEGYGSTGHAEEGVIVIEEALSIVQSSGERHYEAELYRLAGELSLRAGERAKGRRGDKTILAQSPSRLVALSSPEECFLKAIEVARKQQAKSLELRATTSLARLWQQQGKHHAARNALSKIYSWFTEGFDTKDLKEAKALLDELR
jgi:predicted ATPase